MPDLTRAAPPPVLYIPRPSVWLQWHLHRVRPNMRVLDLACAEGRHALAVAQAGAIAVGVDRDSARLETGREASARLGVSVEWICADLDQPWPPLGDFDIVMVFNYLDRARMKDIQQLVRPGGLLITETFLEIQRTLGWGPTSEAHLLRPGELAGLVAPFEILHGREVFETLDGGRQRAVASVVARRT